MANSVDPNQMPHFVVSDQGLHRLRWPVFPNTYSMYGSLMKSNPASESILDPPLSIKDVIMQRKGISSKCGHVLDHEIYNSYYPI